MHSCSPMSATTTSTWMPRKSFRLRKCCSSSRRRLKSPPNKQPALSHRTLPWIQSINSLYTTTMTIMFTSNLCLAATITTIIIREKTTIITIGLNSRGAITIIAVVAPTLSALRTLDIALSAIQASSALLMEAQECAKTLSASRLAPWQPRSRTISAGEHPKSQNPKT